MQGRTAIRRLTVRNLLSFGDQPTTIELKNLNVLIGPNGSGKSNLIEVIGLLQNAPKDLIKGINNTGGIEEWLWKGAQKPPVASVEAIVSPPSGRVALRYRLSFTRAGFRFQITDELIEEGRQRPFRYFGYVKGHPVLNSKLQKRPPQKTDINPQVSVLAQRKDPEHYPEITYLGSLFSNFRLYRDWEFGSLAYLRWTGPYF